MHITFLSNRYLAVYTSVINAAITEKRIKGLVYYEAHHIVPRSLGGNDKKSNIVLLTAKEHYLCHRLLTKFTTGLELRKMKWALHYLSRRHDYIGVYCSSKYERDRLSCRVMGEDHPAFGRKDSDEQRSRKSKLMNGDKNPQYGKTRTDEEKQNLSSKMSGTNNPFYGKKHSGEFAKRNRGETHAMYGKTHSENTRKKIGEAVSRAQTGNRNHRYGIAVSESDRAAQSERMKGRRWLNDGQNQRFVDPETALELSMSGWLFGKIR
jgi:hypothetical protein